MFCVSRVLGPATPPAVEQPGFALVDWSRQHPKRSFGKAWKVEYGIAHTLEIFFTAKGFVGDDCTDQ